jgi:DNA-binding transcriptional LysR family regulator
MESLTGLAVFIQVAETRSFVAAGRILGVSASAVGKRINRLETRLGVSLLQRSTRSIRLTAEGEQFLARSRRVLAEIEAAENEISLSTSAPRGRLRVSLPLFSTLFRPVLAAFMRAYPEIELDLDFTDRKVDVIEEGYDAVVRVGDLSDSRLSARTLGEIHLHLVASQAYLAQHGVPGHPAELRQHRCLYYRSPNSGKVEVWPLYGDITETAHADIPDMICNSLESRLYFVNQGCGIAFLPDFMTAADVQAGTVRVLLAEHVYRSMQLHVLWPSGRHCPPRLRVFIDFLGTHLFPQVMVPA